MKPNLLPLSRTSSALITFALASALLSGCGGSTPTAAAGADGKSTPPIGSAGGTTGSSDPSANTSNGINGEWLLPEMTSNEMNFKMALAFQDDSMTLSNVCTFPDGGTSNAAVTASIENSLKVLEERSANNNSEPSRTCNVKVGTGSMKYSVKGATMTVVGEKNIEKLTLNRAAGTTGNGIIGTWTLPPVRQNGMELQPSFTFTDGSVTIENICVYPDGSRVAVSVSSKIQNSVKILEAKRYENTENPSRTCEASIDAGSFDYLVNGRTLTLTMPNSSDPIQLNRR